MSEKIHEAQAKIGGAIVATMIRDFYEHFRGVYPADVMASSLCAVGPLQSMIGLAIRNGHLAPGTVADELSRLKYPDTTGQ